MSEEEIKKVKCIHLADRRVTDKLCNAIEELKIEKEKSSKKDKVIDLMAEDIYDNDNFWKIKCRVEKIEKGKEKDYIKERFFKKVEEENE